MMSHAAGKHSIYAHTSMPYDVLRNGFCPPHVGHCGIMRFALG